jgi:hypothetical protein
VQPLVLQHHEEQKLIARNLVAQLDPLWGILNFRDLKATTSPWLKAVRPAIERAYLTSQFVAAEFVKNYRRVELPDADPLQLDVPNPLGLLGDVVVPDRQISIRIMVSMKVTGPVWMSNQTIPNMTDQQISEVVRAGFSKSSGAAIRLVLNGGRGMVRTMVDADPLAVGVAGVADEGACRSCKFLTNPIMKSDGSRKMDAVAVGHDFCNCSARVIY